MIKITFTGDVMSGQRIDSLSKRENGYDFIPLFNGLKEIVKDCDYLVMNLETPIAGEEYGYTNEKYRFNTPDEYLDATSALGVDLYCLANNHCMDRGVAGIKRTLETMKQRGLDYVGLADSVTESERAFVKEIGGIKVGFLNYTYGTNAFVHGDFLSENAWAVRLLQPEETTDGAMELLKSNEEIAEKYLDVYEREKEKYASIVEPYFTRLAQEIRMIKEQADFVVAVIHSGGQYNEFADLFTKKMNERVLKAGADIVVGHHPHIIQQSEWVDGKFCAYSLGNFVFAYDKDRKYVVDPRYNVLFNLYLDKDESGVSVSKLTFRVMRVEDDGEETTLPQTLNTYDEYQKKPSEDMKRNILYYANKFIGKEDFYTTVEDEYVVPND